MRGTEGEKNRVVDRGGRGKHQKQTRVGWTTRGTMSSWTCRNSYPTTSSSYGGAVVFFVLFLYLHSPPSDSHPPLKSIGPTFSHYSTHGHTRSPLLKSSHAFLRLRDMLSTNRNLLRILKKFIKFSIYL